MLGHSNSKVKKNESTSEYILTKTQKPKKSKKTKPGFRGRIGLFGFLRFFGFALFNSAEVQSNLFELTKSNFLTFLGGWPSGS